MPALIMSVKVPVAASYPMLESVNSRTWGRRGSVAGVGVKSVEKT